MHFPKPKERNLKIKSNQTKTMAATFRLTAVRFALVGIAALCIAGCGKDEPPAEVNRRPSGDVMTEQKSEKTKAEAEAQRREQALPSPVHAKTKTITLPGGNTPARREQTPPSRGEMSVTDKRRTAMVQGHLAP